MFFVDYGFVRYVKGYWYIFICSFCLYGIYWYIFEFDMIGFYFKVIRYRIYIYIVLRLFNYKNNIVNNVLIMIYLLIFENL